MSFYIVEGPNGVGKTTLINAVKEKTKRGENFKAFSSPGETPLGEMLRPACRGVPPWEDLDPKIKFMLFSSVRYDQYVKIAKDSKEICFADRWWTSTYVYQCMYGNIPVPFLEYTIHPEEKIDGIFLLNGNPDLLIKRINKERKANPQHGKCAWTQDEESIKKINSIYKNSLPCYLKRKGINVIEIDVTKLSPQEVQDIVFKKVEDIENSKKKKHE